MATNRTTGKAPKEAPSEPFKRAVTGCFKAIAGVSEFEVSFASERPALGPDRVRLPEPPRRFTLQDAAIVRGHADSLALRRACHDPGVHRKMLPQGEVARGVFEAVEQARVEAIGGNRMPGVKRNLAAMLQDRYHRANYRRHHRALRGAHRRCGGPHGARAPDRRGLRRRMPGAWWTCGAPSSRSGPSRRPCAAHR